MNSISIPYWLKWIQSVDFAYYAFWLLSVNEFADHKLHCPFAADDPQCIAFDGNVILNGLGFTDHSFVTPSIGLAVVIFGFYFVTFLRLRFAPEKPFDTNVSGSSAPAATATTTATADAAPESEHTTEAATDSGQPNKPARNGNSPRDSDRHGSLRHDSVRLSIVHTVEPVRRVTVTIEHVSLSLLRQLKAGEAIPTNTSAGGFESARRTSVAFDSPRLSGVATDPTTGIARTEILRDVDCHFPSGKLIAIMGSSGCGKTTLLNMIASRAGHGLDSRYSRAEGRILFNETPLDDHTWRSIVGFVKASEPLLPLLTVQETLDYSARLRLPSSVTEDERTGYVQSVIHELGLRDCRHTRVGDEWVTGVSGGERRRVSIGVQMLTDPSVLLLDEPSSGLDASTAQHVTATLKRIAERGRTVICSIHQPRAEQLALFDSVVLMAKGQIVYYGPTGEAMIDYFKRLGYERPVARGNVADWLLDLTAVDLRNVASEAKSVKRLKHLVDHYQPVPVHPLAMQSIPSSLSVLQPPLSRPPSLNSDATPPPIESPVLPPPVPDWKSPLIQLTAAAPRPAPVVRSASAPSSPQLPISEPAKQSEDAPSQLALTAVAASVANEGEPKPKTANLHRRTKTGVFVKLYHEPASFSRAFPVLLSRSWITFRRGIALIITRLLNVIGMGAILWAFFSDAMTHDQAGVQNRIGLIQFYANLFFIGTSNCIASFPIERNIFYRDFSDGTYSTLSFFLAYLVPEVVYELGSALVYTGMAAFGAGLRFTVEDYFLYSLVFFAVGNAGESLGIAFCSIVYEPGLSLTLMNPFVAAACIMAGLYAPSMPPVLKYINFTSVIRFSTRIITIREFTGQTFECTSDELTANRGVCPFTTGEQVLSVYDLTESATTGVAYDLLALVVLALLYRLIAFFLLKRAASKRR